MSTSEEDHHSTDATFDLAASNVKVGESIGPYKLIQPLGEGGFGIVYMAEQREPVQRTVALKIIKLGMDTKEVISRFSAERQALALMDHPNIAHVLDAGATDSGRPYFVMELVKGVPIDDYCDTHNLSLRERLKLFIKVCHAIQHAHQKGIIHRDIKPSNVLVSFQDDRPVPKVIDFGIAKATNQRLSQETMYTQLGQFIGTPHFMSPEQAEMTGLDVDTRSDIYSLGAMLYLMITGTTPFDAETIRGKSLPEIQQLVRSETPPRPSTRLSQMGDKAGRIAQARASTASHLSRQLRGDLDWITFKAMEKDRTRRYETANALAEDLDRYLNNEPVVARPPSASYRLGKLVQRNKAAMTVITVVVLLLASGTVGTTVGLVKARKEAVKSARTAEMMTNMLGGVAPSVARGRDTAMLMEMLRASEGTWHEELAGMPDVEAGLRDVAANVYYEIGEYQEAVKQYRLTLDLLESMHGAEHPDIVEPLTDMGECYRLMDDMEQAEAHSRRAVEMGRRVFDGDAHPLGIALSNLAVLVGARGEVELSIELYVESLEMLERLLGSEHRDVMLVRNNLATAYVRSGKLVEGESMFHELIDAQRKLLGDVHPDLATSTTNLAYTMMLQEKFLEAETHLREAVEISTASRGADHPLTIQTSGVLARVLLEQGKFGQAESVLRESISISTALHGADHPRTLSLSRSLGWALLGSKRFEEAESVLRESLNLAIEVKGADDSVVGELSGFLGALYVRTDRSAEGEELLLNAYDVLVAARSASHRSAKRVATELADYYEASAAASGDEEAAARAEEWRGRAI